MFFSNLKNIDEFFEMIFFSKDFCDATSLIWTYVFLERPYIFIITFFNEMSNNEIEGKPAPSAARFGGRSSTGETEPIGGELGLPNKIDGPLSYEKKAGRVLRLSYSASPVVQQHWVRLRLKPFYYFYIYFFELYQKRLFLYVFAKKKVLTDQNFVIVKF